MEVFVTRGNLCFFSVLRNRGNDPINRTLAILLGFHFLLLGNANRAKSTDRPTSGSMAKICVRVFEEVVAEIQGINDKAQKGYS